MSLEQFLENFTLEEIEELKRLKLEQSQVFIYSKIKESDLKKLFNITLKFNQDIFSSWFNSDISLDTETTLFLEKLIKKDGLKLKYFNEDDLKIKFLSQIFNRIDFEIDEFGFRDFYNSVITYQTDKFTLTGKCDFYIAKGMKTAQKPYFFIQEFKKGKENSDPEPQLLAELIAGVELNNWQSIKGAYIVGSIWNFVILEKVETNSYKYYVSENFDSSKIDDLKAIYKNLLFVKNEIIKNQ